MGLGFRIPSICAAARPPRSSHPTHPTPPHPTPPHPIPSHPIPSPSGPHPHPKKGPLAKKGRIDKWRNSGTVGPPPQNDRQCYLQAKKASEAEAALHGWSAQALFRPFEEHAAVLAAACEHAPKDAPIVLAAQPRDGPFPKYKSEISAERALCIVHNENRGTVHVIHPCQHPLNTVWKVRLQHEHDKPAPPGGPFWAESDVIHVEHCAPSGMALIAQNFWQIEHLENAWHLQRWAGATNDPNAKQRQSVEFGWSTMPGSSVRQRVARQVGAPFRLKAWDSAEGGAFYNSFIVPMLDGIWDAVVATHPTMAAAMLRAVPADYRLGNTGFTKVTVARNNPTTLHADESNRGVTFLASCPVGYPTPPLLGGSHLLCSDDFLHAIVVGDSPKGITLIGDYRRVLHANAATHQGERVILTLYCSETLAKQCESRVGAV